MLARLNLGRHMVASTAARRGLSSSRELVDLLNATRAGHSVVWVAPCAQAFKSRAAASLGSKFVFHNQLVPEYFIGSNVPDLPTTIVVSAQTVPRQFLEAWRENCQEEQRLMLVRRGTSLGSIDMNAAAELGIDVANTPGVNSPHVAKFVVETLGLSEPLADSETAKAVVVGAGSVGQFVIDMMRSAGVEPMVVNRSPESPSLAIAFRGATHVAVCAATSSQPIITASHIEQLLAGEKRLIKICSVSRPEAFSLEAIMMAAQHGDQAQLRFDYGDSILAPTRDQVNQGGVKANISWSSSAMASEACKEDMDEAVLRLLANKRSM